MQRINFSDFFVNESFFQRVQQVRVGQVADKQIETICKWLWLLAEENVFALIYMWSVFAVAVFFFVSMTIEKKIVYKILSSKPLHYFVLAFTK